MIHDDIDVQGNENVGKVVKEYIRLYELGKSIIEGRAKRSPNGKGSRVEMNARPGGSERCGEGNCVERVHFIEGGGADPGQSYIDTGE